MSKLLTLIQRENESIDFKQQRSCSAIPVYFRCKKAPIQIEMTRGVRDRPFKGRSGMERFNIWRGTKCQTSCYIATFYVIKKSDDIFDCLYISND